jgi:hypothetical protein
MALILVPHTSCSVLLYVLLEARGELCGLLVHMPHLRLNWSRRIIHLGWLVQRRLLNMRWEDSSVWRISNLTMTREELRVWLL